MHNNWIINKEHLPAPKDPNAYSQSLTSTSGNAKNIIANSSKSVIIVKPNHLIAIHTNDPHGNHQNASRTSLRKIAGSEKKSDKENNPNDPNNQGRKTFFKDKEDAFFQQDKELLGGEKIRSSSVK